MPDRTPQQPEPFWRDYLTLPEYPSLQEDLEVDVAIVGGGITGITTAFLLAESGVKVALIDASRLMNGTTGHTTAKMTVQHDLIYDELIGNLGEEHAKLYYQANNEAMEWMKAFIQKEQISCDFSERSATLYATTDQYAKKIEKEAKAYDKLGIPYKLENKLEMNLGEQNAVTIPNQGQYHPIRYLLTMLRDIEANGGEIFEQTAAVDIEDDAQPTVVTRDGQKIRCERVVIATHFPFYDGLGFYFTRMYAERSYVLAVKSKSPYNGGMFLKVDSPSRSLRDVTINDEQYVLIGGESHKTGQGIDTRKHYEALETFAREKLGVADYPYRWSAQDLTTLDKVPYIGHLTESHPRVLVATGFRKWGMTHSTVAGHLLHDLILEKQNPYEELYSPSRFRPDPSIRRFLSTNADVAGHLLKGKLELPISQPENLKYDEGRPVAVNGRRAGGYRDHDGKLHVVDTTCTHMGCEVEWNAGDRTWDCPCHGSRFHYDGSVVEGPAKKPLKLLNQELKNSSES